MKKLIYMLLTFVLFISFAYSQQKDSLIQLYPGLGDTLGRFDRNYFDLFQFIHGFEYATFYIRYQDRLVSKIKYTRNNSIYDTTAIQSLAVLEATRLQIIKILLRNDSIKYVQPEAIISTKDGKEYEGNIDMFSKTTLYLSKVEDLQSEKDLDINLSIPVAELDSIILIGKSSVLLSTAIGASVGATFGGIMALASGDDELSQGLSLIAGAFLALVGGVVGYFIGESEDDQVIRIDNQIDLLKLKDYAKYYFQYDESVEENYVELE